MSGIVWLASYPKSGNTWVRVFLSNLLHAGAEPARINALDIDLNAASRVLLEQYTGVESSELTVEEAAALRPLVYLALARQSDGPLFCKIHDALTCTPEGRPLCPPEASRGAIYIIRNPLDVAVSYAHHTDRDVADIVHRMADDGYVMAGGGQRHLPQRLRTWSAHVLSWVDGGVFPVHTVRYEDLHAEPERHFTELARFAGLDAEPGVVQRALRFSSFDALKRQERDSGFVEATARDRAFFRRGRAGSWRSELPAGLAARVVADHAAVMRRFGYLDERNEPIA